MTVKWTTGNWSSYPDDGRCFIERTDHNPVGSQDQEWYVFQTDSNGCLLEGFPKVREEPFKTVEEAQKWAEENC